MKSTLHIYHTNDLHSHFENWPGIAREVKLAKERFESLGESVLYFDCGDHVDKFHPLTEGTAGQGNTALLNDINVSGVTIGNNEGITLTKSELNALYKEAKFPIYVANLLDEKGRRPYWAKPYDYYETKDGLKIGVTGVTVPFTGFYSPLGWEVTDPFDAVRPIIENLRKNADLVIVLSHLGLNEDKRLAQEVEGIDMILGAHTHHELKKGLIINKTFIAQTGKYGNNLGSIKVDYHPLTKNIIHIEADLIPANTLEPDEGTSELIMSLEKKGRDLLNKEIAYLQEPLTISWETPSPFAKLLAETLKEWCKTKLAMVNSGVLLEGLPAGPVTKGDLHRICPHPINPCIIRLKGNELKEVIGHSLTDEMIHLQLKGLGFRGKVIGCMVFSGIDVIKERMKDGHFHVKRIMVEGVPVDDEKIYEIATIDMFTFGHLYPSIARSKHKEYLLPETLRDLLAWKLKS
ncbi:bifunctional UDP-sugar hydrolase/5'-nucleotidase [Fictibacillus sp. Mic-4]|uniref:bifunctional metallophosphatase/5'-nucleotidase n=1 Tax=Fictibacillus TaxID=1329200 RepID=UPI0004134727|nr:bifunctional UDP-sugar hydrolase/5'-nucleotidase [Fictibacillus gelatini]